MGRLFANLSPEQGESLVEERQDFQYSKAWSSPLVWWDRASLHKRAADILYEIGYRAHERYTTHLLAVLTEAKDAWTDGVVSRTLESEELEDKLDMDLIGDYFLLAGYALECILKGCLVVMQPGLLENEKRRNRVILTHDLRRLCRDCGLTLMPEESQLLDLIARYIR